MLVDAHAYIDWHTGTLAEALARIAQQRMVTRKKGPVPGLFRYPDPFSSLAKPPWIFPAELLPPRFHLKY